MNCGILAAFVLCLGTVPAAFAADTNIQALELLKEHRISVEEFRQLVKPAQTYDTDEVTDGNYPSEVTSGDYPDEITNANYPDEVTSGNYPDEVTDSNYGSDFVRKQMEKQIPSPKVRGQ